MKKHRTDLVSLIFGLIFAAFVTWWAVAYATDVEADARWLVVGGLAALGAVILASTLTRRPKPAPEPTVVEDDKPANGESPTEIIERDDDWPRFDEPARDDDEPAQGPRS